MGPLEVAQIRLPGVRADAPLAELMKGGPHGVLPMTGLTPRMKAQRCG